jgi:CoA-substrate-specific enzyme activase, putative
MIGYTCKYTPIELLAGFGGETFLLNDEADNFDYAQRVSHINLCSHAKALLEYVNAHGLKEIVLVNCCDSTRRVYDVLAEQGMDFIYMMDLPHENNECSRQYLKAELLKLAKAYGRYTGRKFDYELFAASFDQMQRASKPMQDFIAIAGGRISDGVFDKIAEQTGMLTVNMTCNANRCLDKPQNLQSADFDEVMEWYAAELLSQIPCMRMSDVARRRELTENPYLKGIIYNTVKFCDYYGFEYENLRKEVSVPITKIETDFTMQSYGQLSTRIGGFLESMGMSSSAAGGSVAKGESKVENTKNKKGKYFAGIDSGSTTTNVAVIDRHGKIVDSVTVRTGAKAQRGAEKAFEALKIPRSEISSIVATGYGRNNIAFADDSVTEITCHAKGAYYINDEIRTIIDIGGQDSKVISIDEKGNVKNFVMNDKCAAGTGRFLENMARVLEMSIDELSTIGLSWHEDLTISSMCTVFAESEVVSLIADNKSVPDIVHGLNKSVAAKTSNLVSRVGLASRVMMTGGGARNKGVAGCIEDLIGEKLIIPDNPDLCGAIGAALFAAGR